MKGKNNQGQLQEIQQLKQEIDALKSLCEQKTKENESLSEKLNALERMHKFTQTASDDFVPGYDDVISLVESKQKAESYLNVAAEIIVSLNREGNITLLNDSGHKLLGYKPGELIGKNWFKTCLPEENHPKVLKLFKKLLQGETTDVISGEGQVITKSNSRKTVYWYNRVLRDPNGNIAGTLSSGKDISEQKHLEQLVELTKERYRIISETTSDFTFSCTKGGKGYEMDWMAGAVERITGYSVDDITAKKCWRFMVHPDDDSLFVKHVLSLKQGEESECELRIYDQKGVVKWLSVNTICLWDEKREQHKIYGGCEDITERKQAEEALRVSEARFKSIIAVSNTGAWEFHYDKNYLWCSPEYFTMLGRNPADYKMDGSDNLSEAWVDLLHPSDRDRASRHFADYLAAGSTGMYENYFRMQHQDGSWVWIWSRGQTLRDSSGMLTQRTVGTHIDITELKRAEEELILAKEKAQESDRLKSAFLANMSHEIRTPMNGILGFAELLKEPHLTDEQQQKYIDIIEKSGERMLNIINDIVDISRIESGLMDVTLKESNVNEQLDFIYTFFKPQVEAKGMQLKLTDLLPEEAAIIETDREKLYAVLANLVKNAIKYSHEGTIEFGCKIVETHGRASLQFLVRDTGIGIPKDRQHAIFERFVQADIEDIEARQGAGLGLAISKAYVKMLGGKIWVESEEEKGSTFYFTIPYKKEHQEADKMKKDESAIIVQDREIGLKILIVEDDELSAMLMEKHMRKVGKEILHAVSGSEAVSICQENPDIDLIMMDVKMPGMDGDEATRQIRQFNKDVVIITQTAKALIGDKQSMLDAGCNDYIAKPINKDHLHELIEKYFRR